MTKLTTREWLDMCRMFQHTMISEKNIRIGQAYMNALAYINLELYKEITEEAICDPFYDDILIVNFLRRVI